MVDWLVEAAGRGEDTAVVPAPEVVFFRSLLDSAAEDAHLRAH